MAHMTPSEDQAAHIAINADTGAVAAWHNEDGCSFRGLNMMPPDPHYPHAGRGRTEKHGDCIFSAGHGSAEMWWDRGGLRWKLKQEEFAAWLVCETEHGEVELHFWHAQLRSGWREEPYRCAAVRLMLVE